MDQNKPSNEQVDVEKVHLEAAGFTGIECGPAKFSIMGLSILAFLRGVIPHGE